MQSRTSLSVHATQASVGLVGTDQWCPAQQLIAPASPSLPHQLFQAERRYKRESEKSNPNLKKRQKND